MSSQFSIVSQPTIRVLAIAVLIFGSLILSAAPAAAQWRITPSVSAGINYDDNIRLNNNSLFEESVGGWAIEGDAKFDYETQLTTFSVTPRLRLNRYDGSSELDSDEVFLDLDYLYTGQLSQFAFRGRYGDESIRTAERSNIDFGVDDPADIPVDDSGRVFGAENRQRILLAPRWSYQTGEKSTIRLGASYLDTAYDENLLGTLRDFTESRGQASFEYNSTQRNTVGLSGYYRKNEFQGITNTLSGYGSTLDFNRSISETTRIKLAIGFDSTEDLTGEKQTNPIGSISLVRNLQTSRLLASYRRTVTASGSGKLSVRDSVNLNYTYNFSEKFSIGTGLSAYQTRALVEDIVSFDERDYLQFRMLFSWNLTRVFAIDLDYAYTNIDRASLPSDADSNLVNLWLRYSPTN
jgi:hypothetical protein